MRKVNSIVPDYYSDFQCKQGSCRSTCCKDWKITLSTDDYFRLIGVECDPDLRRKLDISLKVIPRSTEYEYAEISGTSDGNCPFLTKDCRCGLQLSIGEETLPHICRKYPRSAVGKINYLANSCEAVVEILLSKKSPINFSGWDKKICGKKRLAIEILQDRNYAITDRLRKIWDQFCKIDHNGLISVDYASRLECLRVPFFWAAQYSKAIGKYREAFLSVTYNDPVSGYSAAEKKFNAIIPENSPVFEHLLVNYALSLKMSEGNPKLFAETICSAYSLLRAICVCHTAAVGTVDAFVDSAAGTFRYIQHTEFEKTVPRLLESLAKRKLLNKEM